MSDPDRLSDKFDMSPLGSVATQCVYCKHQARGGLPVCPAFPGWIPDDVQLNEADHRTLYPGQEGTTVFEPRPEVPQLVLDQLYAKLDSLSIPSRR
jgi:hypothetical protein